MKDSIQLNNPQDILAALPYLVKKIPPAPGLATIIMNGGQVKGTVCSSLSNIHITPQECAASLTKIVREEGHDALILVGFGDDTEITLYLEGIVQAALECDIDVVEALRTNQGRYWSLVCQYPVCCPPEGTPIDPDRSAVPAELTVLGAVPAFDPAGKRARCRKVLAPYQVSTTALHEAIIAAQERIEHVTQQGNARFLEYGQEMIAQAVGAQIVGHGPTTITELVNLVVLVQNIRIRDSTLILIPEAVQVQQELWTKVTRAAVGTDRAAPATLTAIAAWCQGNTTMAHAAVEEALQVEPHYSLALLIQQVLEKGMPAEVFIKAITKQKGPQRD